MNILKILTVVVLFSYKATFAQVSMSFSNSNSDVGLCDSRMFVATNLTPPISGWPSTPFVISIEPFVETFSASPLTMTNPWAPFPSCNGILNNLFPPVELSSFGLNPSSAFTVQNRNLTIGNDAQPPNTFFNINYGIEIHNSNVTIRNCEFRDIISDGAYESWVVNPAIKPWGCGIYARGWDVVTSVRIFPVIIESAPVGIYTNFINAQVMGANMNNVVKGVNCEQSLERKVSVVGCNIHCKFRGIDFSDNHNAISMTASGNQIYLEPESGAKKWQACIFLRETQMGNYAHYNISDNWHLESLSGQFGISTLNVDDAKIGYNTVYTTTSTFLPASGSVGISLSGGASNTVNCNHVFNSIPNSNTATIGMNVDVSTNNAIQCNTFTGDPSGNTTGPYTGMRFGGDCDVSNDIAGNQMRDCVDGLYLNSASRIGPQVHRGNIWQNPLIGNTKAINQNINYTNSRIWYNPNSGTAYFPTTITPPQWFVPDPLGITFTGCGTQTCIAAIVGGGEDEQHLKMVALDSAISVDYRDENLNQAQSNLYARLNEDSLLRVSDSVFQTFFVNKQSLAIGQLQKIKKEINANVGLSQQQKIFLFITDSLIEINADSLMSLDSLNNITPILNYGIMRGSLIDNINVLNASRVNIIQQQRLNKTNLYDSLVIENNLIQPLELPEINQKMMNEAYLQFQKNGKAAISSNYEAVLAIAQQCPYAGGPAVIQARALIEQIDETVAYDDDAVCLQSGIYRLMQAENNGSSFHDFKIIPNPATHQVRVELNFANEDIIIFEIRNAIGGIVKKIIMDKDLKSIVFSVNNFEQGVYFIRLRKGLQTINTKKLIVIK